jgi:hypothetical protein
MRLKGSLELSKGITRLLFGIKSNGLCQTVNKYCVIHIGESELEGASTHPPPKISVRGDRISP